MATHSHTIKIGVKADTSGLSSLEKEIKKWENHDIKLGVKLEDSSLDKIASTIKDFDNKTINVKLDITGNFESTLKGIDSKLSSLTKNNELKLNAGGDAEHKLRDIKNQKDDLEKPVTVKLDIDDSQLDELFDSAKKIGEAISESISTAFETINHHSFSNLNSSIDTLTKNINNIGINNDAGMDKIARSIQGATSSVGALQRELNSLSAPEITPQINMPDMGSYYGSYDDLGHLSLGAIGGNRLLSMVGVGSFGKVTWQNASQEQTNSVLLPKFFESKEDNARLVAKNYEGGTNNIAHAASMGRTIRYGDLVSQGYGFSVATNAKAEDMMTNLFGDTEDMYGGSGTGFDVLAAFGEHVQLLTGSEQRARSAMYDLSKGFKGGFSSIDQYGISEETLLRHGFDPKKAKQGQETVANYLRAVGEIIHADEPNDLIESTTEGGLAKLRKRVNASGKQIGQLFMEPVSDLANFYTRLDKQTGGVLTKGIIIATGLTSSIAPLQDTLRQLKVTFDQVKSGAMAFKNTINSLGDSIYQFTRDKSAGDKALGIGGSGMEGILEELNITRNGYQESATHGMFDYTDTEILNSELTDKQKNRLRKQKNSARKIYDASNLEEVVERKARRTKGYENLNPLERANLKSIYRKNELNKIANKGVLGKSWMMTKAIPRSFKGVGSTFRKDGLKAGASALKGSLSKVAGGFLSIVTAINPVTIALAGLVAGLAILGGILLYAYTRSKEFQEKVATLWNKLHELFDMMAFAFGDLLQAVGLTDQGGIDGIIDVANTIIDLVTQGVDTLMEILGVLTGRDVKQDKGIQKAEEGLKNAHKQAEQERKENGGTVSEATLQKEAMYAQQLAMWDPSYAKDPGRLFSKMGIQDKLEQEIVLAGMENYLNSDEWNYVRDEAIPKKNQEQGLDLTYEDYWENVNNESDRKQFWKDLSSDALHKSGIPFLDQLLPDFYEGSFAKNHALNPSEEYVATQREETIRKGEEANANLNNGGSILSTLSGLGFLQDIADGYKSLEGLFAEREKDSGAWWGETNKEKAEREERMKDSPAEYIGKFIDNFVNSDTFKNLTSTSHEGVVSAAEPTPNSDLVSQFGNRVQTLTGSTNGTGQPTVQTPQKPTFQEDMANLFDFSRFYPSIDGLQSKITEFAGAFPMTGLGGIIGSIFGLSDGGTGLMSLFSNAQTTIGGFMGSILPTIESSLGLAPGTLSTIGQNMITSFKNAFTGISEYIDEQLRNAYNTVLGWLGPLGGILASLGASMSGNVSGPQGDNGGSPGKMYYYLAEQMGYVHSLLSTQPSIVEGYSRSVGASLTQGVQYGINSAGGEVFNPLYGTASTGMSMANVTVPTPVVNTTNTSSNGGGNTVTNNIYITGANDDDALAQKVVRVINNKLLWDAQKAGRTV